MGKKARYDSSFVKVPKNILLAINDFDNFDLSVIMVLLQRLRSSMTMDYEFENIDMDEVFLPFNVFKKNENREVLYQKLCDLRRKDIRYRVAIPGNDIEVTTGLFSSVVKIEKGGGVYVRIQKEAKPWLFALGKGYSTIEMDIFNKCETLYKRREYLFFASRTINGSASFQIGISELREQIGCPQSDTPSLIIKRYLEPLKVLINEADNNSIYSFTYDIVYNHSQTGVGRKGIDKINIHFCRMTSKNDSRKMQVISIIQKYYDALGSRNLRMFTTVVNEICEAGLEEFLFKLHMLYTEKYKNDMPHVANTVILALKERHSIAVKKNATGEKK